LNIIPPTGWRGLAPPLRLGLELGLTEFAGAPMLMFLFQQHLRGRAGHPHQETLGWIEACARRDVGLAVFSHREATAPVIAETGAIPVFGLTVEDITRFCRLEQFGDLSDPHLQTLTEFMARGRGVTRGCAQAWASQARRPDLVVFPWAGASVMNGAAEWLADLAPEARPALVFNILGPEPGWVVDRQTLTAHGEFNLFRFAARRLAALAAPGRLLFTATDPRLSLLIAEIGQVDCRPAPLPQFYGGEAAAAARPAAAGPVIGLLGTARAEQGGDLTADIADAVCAADPGARFLLQAPDKAAGLERAEQLRARGGHIRAEVVVGPLPRDAYLRQLLDCDLMLLPYSASGYAMRASGVFADALAMGVPVVVPAHTWMADRLGEGWGAGEVSAASDAADIQAAIHRALAHLPALKARAAERQSAWRAAQSVSAYLDLLLDWAAGVG
jgi:hypothetical protein